MNPRVTVLATLHVVQGAEKRLGNVHDPMYVALLNKLMISEGSLIELRVSSSGSEIFRTGDQLRELATQPTLEVACGTMNGCYKMPIVKLNSCSNISRE
jgi:hypothetical protein